MTIKKAKPPKTFEEQLELLISRGLIVENKEEAIKCLSSLNYYRLRGYYIHLLKEGSDDFIPNVSFSHILSLHDFDTEFRLILLRLLFALKLQPALELPTFLVMHGMPLAIPRKKTMTDAIPPNLPN